MNSNARSKPSADSGSAAMAYTVGAGAQDAGTINASDLNPVLRHAIRKIARTDRLLVGCDYDGTLAPIVPNPNKARPLPEAVTVLRFLANLPDTEVAVVSGRAIRDLAAMSRLPFEVRLVGSHGAEFELDSLDSLDRGQTARLQGLFAECQQITKGIAGTHLESKPSGVAVHVRNASRPDATEVLDALHERFDEDRSIHLTMGKEVLELSVVHADKGSAMDRLRREAQATATVFIGDDITDEHVFEKMTAPTDLTVKVGDGSTVAKFRVAGPSEVLEVLVALGEEREAWLAGATAVPIEDHALLADGTDMALLTPDASISWLCHPGPDAPAILAELLGDPEAGHFRISPLHGGRPLSQNYINDTMTVVTKWAGLSVMDYLDSSHRNQPGLANRLRLIRVVSGSKPAVISFAPRPQFGAVPVGLRPNKYGIKVTGTSDSLVLVAPGLEWTITGTDGPHPTATAMVDPSRGDIVIELRAGTENMRPYRSPEPDRRELTHARWQAFVSRLKLPNLYRREVLRSALTLKALCHEPTGAVLAATTTSLPEWIGGIRNWDYRYCWLRDASMSVNALALLGSTAEADAFLSWLEHVFEATGSPERVHPLYQLDGSTLGPEAVVDTLPGYAGSRPVRIGNAAQGQVQMDVFGPICELIATAARVRGWVTPRDIALANTCVEAVRRRWQEPDHGIWEIRDAPRSHLHSRVMCWMTVDRALRLVEDSDVERPDWIELRDEIRADIETNGWNDDEGTFVSAYERSDVDAGVLSIVTSGFLPATDPRSAATIRAVESSLRDGPTVYRYRHDDGLPGTEGGMHICTTWLIEAYAMAGMQDEAENLLKQYVACSGITGLLPEMYNAGSERGLGNHPQAYSHLGLIRCAIALDRLHSETKAA